jgi:hypothetical protein
MQLTLREPSEQPLKPPGPTPFRKIIALWIPRRFLTSSGANLEAFVADVNDKLSGRRGFVLGDGQILTTPLKMSDSIELTFGGDDKFDVPPYRPWEQAQRDYFGIQNPYQMTEDDRDYTQTHITAAVSEPYLFVNERIAAVLHGQSDNYYFYCPCHCAEVVYTTAHRFVCIGCGAMHAVLQKPLSFRVKRLLTAEEWAEYFDVDGRRREEEVKLSIVDFRQVESAETLWTTNQWEEARQDFVFFARSSPEEIVEAIRGTELDPSVCLEAGWTPVSTPPPPAHQVADDSVEVDLLENAGYALGEGVNSYLAAQNASAKLVNAIPQLFRATELLLKAKLHTLDSHALKRHPDNPTVLKLLAARGTSLQPDEETSLQRLRRMRNNLQHGTARFNHRTGLAICRKTIIFLDRFANMELGLWLGDAIPEDDWCQLLKIPELAMRADRIAEKCLDRIRNNPKTEISQCPRCQRPTLVRPEPKTGASCVRCGYIPVFKNEDD